MKRRALVLVVLILVSFGALVSFVPPVSSINPPSIIYNSIPSPLSPNLPSQAWGAPRGNLTELGEQIGLVGTPSKLNTITVTMSDWACQTGNWGDGSCVSALGSTYAFPITLNIYGVNPTSPVSIGYLIATNTTTFNIPYRPSASASCVGDYLGGWMANNGLCYHGYVFNISFNFTTQSITLPSQVIFGIAYYSDTFGGPPNCNTATRPACSLNLAYVSAAPSIGVDINPDAQFRNATVVGANGNVGYNIDGQLGVFRQDTGWTGYRLSVEFTANPLTSTSSSTSIATVTSTETKSATVTNTVTNTATITQTVTQTGTASTSTAQPYSITFNPSGYWTCGSPVQVTFTGPLSEQGYAGHQIEFVYYQSGNNIQTPMWTDTITYLTGDTITYTIPAAEWGSFNYGSQPTVSIVVQDANAPTNVNPIIFVRQLTVQPQTSCSYTYTGTLSTFVSLTTTTSTTTDTDTSTFSTSTTSTGISTSYTSTVSGISTSTSLTTSTLTSATATSTTTLTSFTGTTTTQSGVFSDTQWAIITVVVAVVASALAGVAAWSLRPRPPRPQPVVMVPPQRPPQ